MTTGTQKPDTSTCRLVRAGPQFEGKQGLTYAVGISAESVGSKHVHLQLATIAPGARAKAHLHAEHETAIYQLSGVSGCWYGERLEHHATVRAGDFFYIPAGAPHVPYNASADEPCVAVIAQTDPNEQKSVTMRPDLDALPDSSRGTPLAL
ncbi:cupin domain-containing protein [Caballeronia sordidicola]|uniref:cupin domain-containing protein n=1 Tax=Caballeronia sordidicola TaxID=196367 RepID=UPI0004CFF8E4|nr:cupin domain-containing protein [Caballeronia sordidicola]